jgi:chemotaxis protein MotA
MDIGTLLGVIGGLVLIGFAMAIGDGGIGQFVNVPSVLIVIGGTVAATAIAFPTKELKNIVAVSRRVFRNSQEEVNEIVTFLTACAQEARKNGLLALENMARRTKHKPLAKGLALIADGTDSATLHEILSTELKQMKEHHNVGKLIFAEMGKFAPAFGMIGTLVGLVQMLANLSDPSTIGPNMAVALLTTLYGALLANLIFLPMVTKLERRSKIEAFEIELMNLGLVSINRGESTQILKEKLDAFLAGVSAVQKAATKKAA